MQFIIHRSKSQQNQILFKKFTRITVKPIHAYLMRLLSDFKLQIGMLWLTYWNRFAYQTTIGGNLL